MLFILQYTIVYKQDTLLFLWAGNSTEKQLYSMARRRFIMLKIWNKSSVQRKISEQMLLQISALN